MNDELRAEAESGRARLAGLFSSNRAIVALCFMLLTVVCVNLVSVLNLPLWQFLLPLFAAALITALVWRVTGARAALLRCLALFNVLALFAVALTLALPVWHLLFTDRSLSWAGRMAPLFVAALALYTATLWLNSAAFRARHTAKEQLARMLSGGSLTASLFAALVLCACFLFAIEWWPTGVGGGEAMSRRFLERGVIPPITVLLFSWGLLLLAGKLWNIRVLRRALNRMNAAESQPAWGISYAELSKSFGDFDEDMRFLWRRLDESYLLLRYIVWAVPVLGFIGTVLGISLAADGIRRIMSSEAGFSGLSSELGGAIAPLGIAFDTTLIALSLSLVLMLFLTLVQRGEESTLSQLESSLRNGIRGD